MAKQGQSVTLYNDALYVIGGYTTTYVISTQKFTISTSTWSDLTSTGFSVRAYHTANLHNAKIYVIGGMSSSTAYLNDIRVYTISSNTWATITADGDTFTSRAYHTATTFNDAIYVWGGVTTSAVYLNNIMKYDTITNTWTQLNTMDNVLAHHTAVLYNNIIYVVCGKTADNVYSDKAFTYNIATNTITTIAYASGTVSPFSDHASTLYNSIIYVFGGEDIDGRRSDVVQFVHDAPGILLLQTINNN